MATTRIALSANTYTDLGATPCTIQVQNNRPIYMVVTSSGIPAANTLARVIISDTQGRAADIGYASQNVWAKATSMDFTTYVVVIR